jgi:hypothetical protein
MNRLQTLQAESSLIALGEDERQEMREALLSYMGKTPVAENLHVEHIDTYTSNSRFQIFSIITLIVLLMGLIIFFAR